MKRAKTMETWMKSLLFSFVCCLILWDISNSYVSIRADDNKEHAAPSDSFLNKLKNALEVTKDSIKKISDEWEIPNYPRFLKSCFMHKSAWEIMKWKYMRKILEKEITKNHVAFVISFSGSSVTAGHDSHFNQSTPVVVGEYMRQAFDAVDVKLDSRNVALGNNPCMPYDLCIKFFAGYDADVVHWEQNYFCEGSPLMEQFIRQAMTIPTRPIVIFGESNTAHWEQKNCKTAPHKITPEEKSLLTAELEDVVSEMNKDELHRIWPMVSGVLKHYHGAAIQTFSHSAFEQYACLGPYIKTWMQGAASWHPSVVGHRVRAAHHSYIWLHILKDALKELISSHRALDAQLKDVVHHLDHNYKPMEEKAVHQTQFVDNTTCYTDYEPRSVQEVSLKGLVISGMTEDPSGQGWKYIIYEDLVDKNLVQRSKQHGYLDFKHLLYSDDTSGDLSLKLNVPREGPIFICQTPGIWGALPSGFTKLWEAPLDVYITHNVQDYANFKFDAEKAEKQEFMHEQIFDICVMLKSPKGKHEIGNHVITLHLREKKKVIFAWLLTP